MKQRWGTILKLVRSVAAGLGLLVLLAVAFSISGEDAGRVSAFADAVSRWQVNPDFRKIGPQYAIFSNQALQARPFGVSASKFILFLRSAPFLPHRYAVAPTSWTHYRNFTHGPLSAYLHLCSEQGLEGVLGSVKATAEDPDLTDDECRQFLLGFNIFPSPATDDGAVMSLRRMLIDIDAKRDLVIKTPTREYLEPICVSIAQREGMPADLDKLSIEQQLIVLDKLDAEVKAVNLEVWRTKQLNDFLNGVWAQAFGLMYCWLSKTILYARIGSRVLLVGIAAWAAVRYYRRRKAAQEQAVEQDLPEAAGA